MSLPSAPSAPSALLSAQVSDTYTNTTDFAWWKAFFATYPITQHTLQQLYPHQVLALEQIAAAIAQGKRRINVILPTGAGKSHVIGLMPFVARRGASLCICRWDAINKSNSLFYKKRFPVLMNKTAIDRGHRSLLGRINTASAAAKVNDDFLDGVCIDIFGSIKFMRHMAALLDKYALVQVDEPQDLWKGQLDLIAERMGPDAVLVTYSAFPPAELVANPDFFNIEVSLAMALGFVKKPRIELISTATHICYEDIGVKSHDDLMARANPDSYDNPATAAPAALLTRLYRTEDMFLKTLKVALRLRDSMARNGRTPGIVFKASRQDICEHWAGVLNHHVGARGIRSRIITTDTKDDRELFLKEYAAGSVDVLFLCQMLSVGWHDSRTAIICPLGGLSFSSLLQTFGRGNAKDPDFAENVIVLSDVFMTVTQFPQKFKHYATHGLVRDTAQAAVALQAEDALPLVAAPPAAVFDHVQVDSAAVALDLDPAAAPVAPVAPVVEPAAAPTDDMQVDTQVDEPTRAPTGAPTGAPMGTPTGAPTCAPVNTHVAEPTFLSDDVAGIDWDTLFLNNGLATNLGPCLAGGADSGTVGGAVSETVGGAVSETVGGAVSETVGGAVSETVGGAAGASTPEEMTRLLFAEAERTAGGVMP